MESYNLKTYNGCGEVRAVRFAPQGGVAEYNIMIRTSLRGSFSQQLESIRRSFDEAVGVLGCDGAEVMFGRWFLSDAVNQVPELPERFAAGGCRPSSRRRSTVRKWRCGCGWSKVPNGTANHSYTERTNICGSEPMARPVATAGRRADA